MNSNSTMLKSIAPKRGRPKKELSNEKRRQRDIANENERRRMHSINNGFESLRQIIKRRNHANERESKATVLNKSIEYINWLESEISSISYQNQLLKTCINANQVNTLFEKRSVNFQSEFSDEFKTYIRAKRQFDAELDRYRYDSRPKTNWLADYCQDSTMSTNSGILKESLLRDDTNYSKWIDMQKQKVYTNNIAPKVMPTHQLDIANDTPMDLRTNTIDIPVLFEFRDGRNSI